jgi:diguanylate cyclase (GGDEF)-like protein
VTTSDDAVRLRSLLDIAKVVGAARRFDDLVELTAEEARRALDAASLSISRWQGEQGALRVLVNVGVLAPGEVRFPTDEIYASAVYEQADTLVQDRRGYVADVDGDDQEAELLRRLQKDSCLGVPIVVDASVWGAIYATRFAGQPRFTAADIDFATAVATQVAAGVVQADHVARIERLAFQDPLTGLANRRAVDDRLEAEFAPDTARPYPVSVVLADINRLKQVNDSFGHEAGDRAIIAIGDAVSRASGLVPGSMAARIGGDEFCVVVSGAPAAAAVGVAEELCRLVDRLPMSTGVSCGVASSEAVAGAIDSPVRLLRLADAAQYRAKRARSRTPVVAGQSSADDPEPHGPDRRTRRGASSARVPQVLDAGLSVLDDMRGAGAQARVEAVTALVAEVADAAGWWVSEAPGCGDLLVSRSSSVQREADLTDPQAAAVSQIGATFDLRDYPETARAVRETTSFYVEIGAPGNDPDEEAALVVAGYRALLAAGASDGSSGWLAEIFSDPLSLGSDDLEPVLRALVAVAVGGAAPDPADVGVPASRSAADDDGAAAPSG